MNTHSTYRPVQGEGITVYHLAETAKIYVDHIKPCGAQQQELQPQLYLSIHPQQQEHRQAKLRRRQNQQPCCSDYVWPLQTEKSYYWQLQSVLLGHAAELRSVLCRSPKDSAEDRAIEHVVPYRKYFDI